MASEKAKELARQQKAAAKAERERRRQSDDPKDWGQVRQLRETWKITAEQDKQMPLLVIGAFVAVVVVMVVLGIVIGPWWFWTVLGIMLGLTAAMFIFTRRVKGSMYKRFEGQAGSGQVALDMLPKKWHSSPAINGTREMDVIHRTFGPGGLVLITEGSTTRLKPLLATEIRRHEQAAGGQKVTHVQVGDKPGQVPLNKLADHIKKLPKQLDDAGIDDLANRIKALDTMRSKMPIPKGPMPTRVSRSAMRGR